MKRQPSRAPSPTPTAFSGISTYQNNNYRSSTRDKPGPVPQIDFRTISKTHFEELGKYLAAYLARSQPNSRSTARQKLTRLTIQQFHELSTDVYDELIRRKNEREVIPFLPVREDFHPKRNQARQKLATLPTSRFEDLSSDVYFELARRYPEFKEDPSGTSADAGYDDYPSPEFNPNSQPRSSNSRTSGRMSTERPPDSGYGGSVSSRRPSEDRRRPSETDIPVPRRSEENYADQPPLPSRSPENNYGMGASRRKPSQDTSRRSEDQRPGEFARRPSATASISNNSDSTATMGPAQSTTAGSGMIIPNKSTIEEEYIEVPYGREQRESGATIDTPAAEQFRDAALGDDSASDYQGAMSPRSPPAGGLNGLSSRLREIQDEDDNDPQSSGNKSGDDFYDKYGRSSVASDRSLGQVPGRMASRASVNDEQEKIRRDYEYKIATMQSQITSLQRDLADSEGAVAKWKEAEARVVQLEDELDSVRQRSEEQSGAMMSLQREVEELQELRQRDKERETRRIQDDEEELQILRDRCEKLESERTSSVGETDKEFVEQLRTDMEGLLLELDNLNRRNDELMTAKDSDLSVIRDLNMQLKDYKRKYEQAKTELRSVKATSQIFLPTPKFEKSDDLLPMSPDGGILDVHITAFLSAIDSLLTAGRSNAPTRVLTPMKTVVNAVTNIVDDVRAFERRPPRNQNDVDLENLRALRDRAEVTLSNLVAATRTHATSSGLSPVSLLDAAASHVSASITELGKLVCLRKATKAEQDQFPYNTAPASASSVSGYIPGSRSLEGNSAHQRKASQGSTSSSLRNRFVESPSSPPTRNFLEQRRRPPSQNSSSEQTNSPPPIFDQRAPLGGALSDDSNPAEGEDQWAELKPYLEAQTEAIVYAIQSVLSGVRSPNPPPSLNENLTQIITIVSSIVAVCKENLPPASVQQGNEILRELVDHANKLSEVQTSELSKESRQIMAKSSFAIANAMKGLMKLG